MSDSRGQTVIDFAVGATIFIVAVGVVFAFVPSIFEPFSTAAGSSSIVADRTANHLTGSLLVADPARPSALSAACTAALFNQTNVSGCEFDATAEPADLLGVGERDVNVTVRNLSDSPTNGPPVDGNRLDSVAFDGPLTLGTTGSQSDVSVASRVVSIEGDQYRLVVKVW